MVQNAHGETSVEGFILTRRVLERKRSLFLEYWLYTDAGPVCVETRAQKDVFFIYAEDLPHVELVLRKAKINFESAKLELKSFTHELAAALYFETTHTSYRAKDCLAKAKILCYEADIRLADRFLMERFIYGSMSCIGEEYAEQSSTNHIDNSDRNAKPKRRIIVNAQCKASNFQANFQALSMDIECSENGELYSIGFAAEGYKCVLMIGELEPNAPSWIYWLRDEKALLLALIEKIEELDPDIIIGWNIVNFDFRVLVARAEMHELELKLGRQKQPVSWRDGPAESNQGFVSIPGRVVIDGINALKSATYQFSKFSLEFVAQELLGKGKKTEQAENRLEEIEYNFQHQKVALAEYNLQDCKLVLEIFAKTNLLQFLILRSQLTGLELDRMGGSVAAFVNLFLPRLHRAGYIAPNRPEGGGLASPGGYVMESKPGLYSNVLVLDFKSLYPSIIRTFKIDPLGLVEGLLDPENSIPGFKGAFFSRDKHFLPGIINELWKARDKAKEHNDSARSQAIKILMNSFYGVLGSGGCPFYDTRLASSITMRGQEIMQETAQWIEQEGYEVIYGDTDSTFVRLAANLKFEEAESIGRALEKKINLRWTQELRARYDIECALEIEFETYFRKFLMPTIRGSSIGSKKRYAGLKQSRAGDELIFKGLETVRSDWTALAKEFQTTLYAMIFAGEQVEPYVLDMVTRTLKGKNDSKLVYQKRLGRELDCYVKTAPPHVKAARFADEINRKQGRPLRYQAKGTVSYILTLDGPQTVEHRISNIDYEHYIEKQIRPVAEAILPFVGLSFDSITASQLGLFS